MNGGTSTTRCPAGNNLGSSSSRLTQAQSLIWTAQKLVPHSPAYNMAWRFDFAGPIDEEKFRAAFGSVVSRCDALRLIFEEVGGAVRQRVSEQPAGTFHLIAFENADEAGQWIEHQLGRVFDLSRETFQSSLLRIGGGHWVWFFNQHHLATDANSGEVIHREVARAYDALLTGDVPDMEPMPSFLAHAAMEHAARDPEAEASWRRHLSRPAALPRLYGRHGSGLSSNASGIVTTLSSESNQRLMELVASEDFGALSRSQAVFNILATVMCAWISRVSGVEEPSLGVVTHGRRSLQARSSAGCFVELFPLQTRLEAGESFRSLHAKVAQEGIDLLRNAAPGASSAEAHGRFNVVLNLISATFGDFAGESTQVEWLDNGHTEPRHALRVNITDFGGDGSIELAFLFSDSVFDTSLRRRAVGHVLSLLDGFLVNPDCDVSAVALAGADEASTALTARAAQVESEATPVEDVVTAFRRIAAEKPHAIAVRDDRGEMRRSELDARSDEMASALHAAGARTGDLVGLHLTRSAEMVAAILGILKLGASFVPLDPAQPAGRLDVIAEEAGLRFTISEDRLTQRWSGGGRRILTDKMDGSTRAFPLPSDASAAAYVMFTSGSTGRPKGVQVPRRALARYADWARKSYADGAAAWALHSAIGFDLTITSIFAPLAGGGEIKAYRESFDGPDLSILRVFDEDAVDVVKLTPAHLALVLEASAKVRRIRSLVLGGEDLPATLARRAQDMLGPGGKVYNEYGPTEAVVGCMIHRFDAGKDDTASVPIGKPAEATRIYVLDNGLNPVPDEVTGELYVAGPDRLADGYLGRAAETDAKFVPDPFRPGAKMYRTGDLASVRPDGVIRYHGRADEQVKIGGVRIELGEVHSAVLAHPAVEACTLSLSRASNGQARRCSLCGNASYHPDADIEDPGICAICNGDNDYRETAGAFFKGMDDLTRAPGGGTGDDSGLHGNGEAIICHYVAQDDLPSAELRRSLTTLLPREMIPTHLVAVDTIPLTPNGKVDRSALPAPTAQAQLGTELGSTPPRTPLEAQIHEIWQRVLRRDGIGVEDSFYDLGGDSIAAIQIATRSSAAGLEITAVDVFRQQSIAALAAMPGTAKARATPRPKAKAELDPRSRERLAEIFGRRSDV